MIQGDLNEVVVFAKVADSGSFTAAAADLDMPKSTVSRKVADLEARLGARLLQRTTRKLNLTDAGRTYYEYAARAVLELEAGSRAVAALDDTPRGPLRVTAPLDLRFLGPICAELIDLYPEIRLELSCTDRVVDLIEEGFDLAIRIGTLGDSSLIAQRLTSWRGLLVASDRYLDRRGTPTSPKELAEHDCVVFTASRGRWRLESGRKAAEVEVSGPVISNDLSVIDDAAVAGHGIAMVAPFRCAAHLAQGNLQRVLPKWSAAEVPLHAVYPSRRHLAPQVRAFVDLLRDRLSSEPW